MNSRLGKLSISEYFFKSKPDTVMKIMGQCLVLRCEYSRVHETFEYEVCCQRFDELPLGHRLPKYLVKITESGEIEFEREKQ